MSTYTFFLEFDGGTYISQVSSLDERAALVAWATQQLQSEEPFPGARELMQEISRDPKAVDVTEVLNLVGVWCFSEIFQDKLVLTHIVLGK